MKALHRLPTPAALRLILLVTLLFMVTWVMAVRGHTQADGSTVSNCKIGSRSAGVGFWTWEPGSHVQVYVLQNSFTSDELPYLTKAVERWDAVGEFTGSRVRITYAGTTVTSRECENCVTILRGRIYNQKTHHGGEIKAYGVVGTQIIKYATITIDPKVNNSKLSHAVAHEVGHSFGLLDCYTCKRGSTVMRQFAALSFSDIAGPTPCDVAQVRKAYEALALRPAPVAVVPEDKGEEPVPDDTPLVVPEP
jgi:hypothetical protein